MKRTIFEIPGHLQQNCLKALENYSISYTERLIPGTSFIEIEITHHKSQNYIIEMLDQEFNLLAEVEYQRVSA